ncbi:MAG TPA: HEAT repeat domain-containing protein [Gemmatirosa sp.]|nr:HEAT repeat domain-containing protein [Gemmatirosa sp.]
MDMDAYRVAFRGSAMKRAKLPMMKRNAAVVLGNVGTADDVHVLTRALGDPEPLVREHAAWALIQIGSSGMVAPARPGPDPCDAELEGASGDAMLIPTPGSAT